MTRKHALLVSVLTLLFILLSIHLSAQHNKGIEQLKVSQTGRYLEDVNGHPFFWLGDTAWELFHRLTIEEITTYLENRHKKGFNIIQAVILAELNGLGEANKYGQLPFIDKNPDKPNDKYFHIIDTTVQIALSKNMYIALLPTWGDKVSKNTGEPSTTFNEKNALNYGLYLGKRYKLYPNIVWILGGDRAAVSGKDNYVPIWEAMARGIEEGTGKPILVSYHPPGYRSSSSYFHNEKWFDFNMIQSSHADRDMPIWEYITKDWNLQPAKPTMDAEPPYEGHPVNPWPTWDPKTGYFRAYDVRRSIYRSVFSGGMGVTYGHHSIWQFYNPAVEKINYAENYWYEVLDQPGAIQAGFLKNLIISRPFNTRLPDQSIILKGQGAKGEYVAAFRDAESTYLMVYLPLNKKISIDTRKIAADRIKVWLFDPQTGKPTGAKNIKNTGSYDFEPGDFKNAEDLVLIIDDYSKGYKKPGSKPYKFR